MKEKYMPTQIPTRTDDLNITPSEELNRATLAAMEKAAVTVPAVRKKCTRKRILACAALVSAMFMLMGAGYRVFSYLAYVPGQGIVMQDTDRVYVLKTAADADGYRIDAISMVPVQEGEHKGKWEVTMLTEYPDNFFYSKDGTPLSELPITMQSADGTACQLTCDANYIDRARYHGYADSAASGSWEITRWGNTCTVVLTPASKLAYANHRYPTESGLTVICYPVSENSDILAMAIDFSKAGEDMRYWLDKSSYHFSAEITVTDINGGRYKQRTRESGFSGYSYTDGSFISYLDRPLEAPVATIEVKNLLLDMSSVPGEDFGSVQIRIPEEGETVSLNSLPILNHHGINITLQDISAAVIPSQHRKNVFFNSFTVHTVAENRITPEDMPEVFYFLNFRMADDPRITAAENGQSILSDFDAPILRSTTEFILRDDTLPIRFGEDVVITLNRLTTQVFDTWTIDFTATEDPVKDPGIPKDAIHYGK